MNKCNLTDTSLCHQDITKYSHTCIWRVVLSCTQYRHNHKGLSVYQWHSQDDRLTRAPYGHAPQSCKAGRCVEPICPHEAQKKIFPFIFHLSGWALVAPSCFALRAGDLCYYYHWQNFKLVQFSSLQQKHSSQTVTAVYDQYDVPYSCMRTPITAL